MFFFFFILRLATRDPTCWTKLWNWNITLDSDKRVEIPSYLGKALESKIINA